MFDDISYQKVDMILLKGGLYHQFMESTEAQRCKNNTNFSVRIYVIWSEMWIQWAKKHLRYMWKNSNIYENTQFIASCHHSLRVETII